MGLLPEEQGDQVKLLVAILAVAAAALYYNFIYGPGKVELLDLDDRVADVEGQNQAAEIRIGNLQLLRDDLTRSERELAALERLVPEGSEVPEIYEAIAAETQSLNLRLISIEPLAPTPADSAGHLMRQEWAMTIEGGYHGIGQFLARVASYDRIVRPSVSEIGPAGVTANGRQQLRATFSLETFVIDPNSVPDAAAEEPVESPENLMGE